MLWLVAEAYFIVIISHTHKNPLRSLDGYLRAPRKSKAKKHKTAHDRSLIVDAMLLVGVNKILSDISALSAVFMAAIQGVTTVCLCEYVPSTVNLAAMVLSAKHPNCCVCSRLQLWCVYVCVFQRRSVSRWRGYAGRPEAICRSSVSTSSGDANYASPAA